MTPVVDTPASTVELPNGNRAVLPRLTCSLPGGRVGHFQRSFEDCGRAAVATALQLPYEDVPESAQTPAGLLPWALERGLMVDFHERELPVDAETWIAVTAPLIENDPSSRHVLVMERGEILFDPGSGFVFPEGWRRDPLPGIEYGVTFEPGSVPVSTPPEGHGWQMIIASEDLPAPTSFAAYSEFTTESGAITGDSLSIGGTWQGAGDADDFTVVSAVARRTAVSDAGGMQNGRLVVATTPVLTDVAARLDLTSPGSGDNGSQGLLLRYVDTSNFLSAQIRNGDLWLGKRVAGVDTTIATNTNLPFPTNNGDWLTLLVVVSASGTVRVWAGSQGSALGVVLTGADSTLATGGALDDGKVGMIDHWPAATAKTREYDNFAAWVAEVDVALDTTAELRTDGYWRQSSAGMSPAVPLGDLPRMPLGGIEGRDVEVLIKPSEGNLDDLPDSGRDAPSVRIAYRPSWLFPPR
jgi:hypothetical protein